MESKLQYHLLKAVSELEANLAEAVVNGLVGKLAAIDLAEAREGLLTDHQLCGSLQISISHFYKLKKKHRDFPVYDIGGAKRYKLSEVENYFKPKPDGRQ